MLPLFRRLSSNLPPWPTIFVLLGLALATLVVLCELMKNIVEHHHSLNIGSKHIEQSDDSALQKRQLFGLHWGLLGNNGPSSPASSPPSNRLSAVVSSVLPRPSGSISNDLSSNPLLVPDFNGRDPDKDSSRESVTQGGLITGILGQGSLPELTNPVEGLQGSPGTLPGDDSSVNQVLPVNLPVDLPLDLGKTLNGVSPSLPIVVPIELPQELASLEQISSGANLPTNLPIDQGSVLGPVASPLLGNGLPIPDIPGGANIDPSAASGLAGVVDGIVDAALGIASEIIDDTIASILPFVDVSIPQDLLPVNTLRLDNVLPVVTNAIPDLTNAPSSVASPILAAIVPVITEIEAALIGNGGVPTELHDLLASLSSALQPIMTAQPLTTVNFPLPVAVVESLRPAIGDEVSQLLGALSNTMRPATNPAPVGQFSASAIALVSGISEVLAVPTSGPSTIGMTSSHNPGGGRPGSGMGGTPPTLAIPSVTSDVDSLWPIASSSRLMVPTIVTSQQLASSWAAVSNFPTTALSADPSKLTDLQ
jgi:hypothetical protein